MAEWLTVCPALFHTSPSHSVPSDPDLTAVTIAHRLKTIIEYDRIIVLDSGKLAEHGAPIELLEREGIFYEMVSKNGRQFEQEMRALASKKRERRN